MLSLLLLLLGVAATSPLPTRAEQDHHHVLRKRLPSSWFHAEDHQVHNLFKRAGNDGVDYATVGSSEWSNSYPSGRPETSNLPRAWVDALDAAADAGRIPNIPRSTNTPETNPVYPQGTNPMSPQICSATYKCRHPEDTWNAPEGIYGLGFDDGPETISGELIDFLEEHDETATHFMIGVNIRANPEMFNRTFSSGGDIAVHGYNHLYSTTLSNLEIVAQLGWTMEIIHNSTGGRVPKFWRPPYGDSDNRVRAIAKEVFGLHTIIWNQDTRDWSIAGGATTHENVMGLMRQWLAGPKDPGLIVLEHEVSEASLRVFFDSYPLMKSNGWDIRSVAQIADGSSAYQNAASSNSDTVEPAGILYNGSGSSSDSSTSQAPALASSSTRTSSNPAASSTDGSASSLRSNQNNSALQVMPSMSILLLFLGALVV